jgi:hypothetical protein
MPPARKALIAKLRTQLRRSGYQQLDLYCKKLAYRLHVERIRHVWPRAGIVAIQPKSRPVGDFAGVESLDLHALESCTQQQLP